jgi:hypothetical protein
MIVPTTKKCPLCLEPNEEWRVICKTQGCVFVWRADNPLPNVATVGRSYPTGTDPDDLPAPVKKHMYLN